MKNNAPRNSIFNCRRPLSVLLLGVVVPHAQVIADVPPPPPVQHQNAGFPSAQKLEQMGYNSNTGVWKVQTNPTGKPTVSSGGGQITGTQGQRVTVTDGYGNKATVNTQVTQRVATGKLQTAANAAIVGGAYGGAVGSATKQYGQLLANQINSGNWEGALQTGFNMGSHIADNLLGGALTGIKSFTDGMGWTGKSNYEISQEQLRQIAAQQQAAQAQAEKAGNYQKAVAHAAAKKAAEAAAKAKAAQEAAQLPPTKNENGKTKYWFFVRFKETALRMDDNGSWVDGCCEHIQWVSGYSDSPVGRYDDGNISNDKKINEIKLKIKGEDIFLNYKFKFTGEKDYYDILSTSVYDFDSKIPDEATKIPEVNTKDFQLTQQEMLDILKRMLENQQTNHNELMNQLAKMGNVVPSSTTSTEFTPATATTAPYTPSGSNTPQQTQVTINKDGSVTTSVIPRPDLVPNSPQAPTRSPLIPNNPSTPTTPTSPTSPNTPTTPTTPTSPNNPSTPNTPDNTTVPNKPKEDQPPQENTAYEDPDIPTKTVDLDFKPADIFSVDGVCPEPRTVDFGMFGQHEFSYEPLCDFARKIRPILILITIVSCSFFVYSSLKD